jgi:hypothetical protein
LRLPLSESLNVFSFQGTFADADLKSTISAFDLSRPKFSNSPQKQSQQALQRLRMSIFPEKRFKSLQGKRYSRKKTPLKKTPTAFRKFQLCSRSPPQSRHKKTIALPD